MKIQIEHASVSRKGWSLSAHGTFTEGIHLVSGRVGSGKTTLALLLAGLLEPSAGTVRRVDISSLMVSFQFPEHHMTGATVRDECRSWGTDPDAIMAATRLTGREGLSPLRLSRGEQKRLHLSCVMARPYDLLILDEPFSSLDCREKERVCGEISLRSQGITIIFTHEQAFFPRVDYIWEISDSTLHCRGALPHALCAWEQAPEIIKKLVARGRIPDTLTPADLREAACRT